MNSHYLKRIAPVFVLLAFALVLAPMVVSAVAQDPYTPGIDDGDDDYVAPPAPIICNGDIDLTKGAVVGSVVASAPLHWEPVEGSLIDSLSLPVGQTFWVLGHDEAEAFYKVVVACSTVWVPFDSLGPNYAAPWFGAALPDIVVQ
jgi:hypothetical protein